MPYSCNVSFLHKYITRVLKYSYVCRLDGLSLAKYDIKPSETHSQFLSRNSEILEYAIDFKIGEDEYDELFLQFDKRYISERLKEWEDDVV